MSDVYVFGFLDVVELEPDEFTLSFAKNKINCPRCKNFIEKAEKLLTDRRLLTKQDIAGICDHCWKQLAKIKGLVRLTKQNENIAAVAESDALKTQIEQAKRLYEQNVKEPKGFTERATTLGTLTPQTYISEGKADDEKLLVREESPRAADKKIKAGDEKNIARGVSEREKDTELIAREESLSEKGKTIKEKDKKLMAQEKLQSTTDTKSKARDKIYITQEELPGAKDERSKTRGAQEEPQSTKDQKSKAGGEKQTGQVETQSTRDLKSKARREQPTAQEEPVITRDKKSSKVNAEKTKVQGELLTDKDKKDKKSIAREESPTANVKSKARDERSITKNNLQDANAKKYKMKDAQEKLLTGKDNKSKARDEQSIANDESLRAKDKKEKRMISVKNEEELKVKDNKSNVRDGKPLTKEEALITKGKLEGKENIQKEKPPQKSTSVEQLKALIAQEKLRMEKEKLEIANKKKQQEEEKKLLEIAEKRAKEAALEVAMKANANQPPKIILPISVSGSNVMLGPEYAVHKAPVVRHIIIGETICKKKKMQCDTDEDSQYKEKISKLPAVVSGRHGIGPAEVSKSQKKGRVPEFESPAKVPVVGSENPKNGAIVESENTEKVSTVKVKGNPEKATKRSKQDSEAANNKEDGRIRYALSDPTFIEKGWSKLPFEKVVRKMNVYRMLPSKPEFDWFEHHKNKVLEYDTGEILAEVDESGRGRWYYRSGALAMDYYDAEEMNAGQRFVVYSTGAPDAHGRPRPRTVLATFDHAGSGIVFDHAGKTRLKYNQTEGIVLDREIGPVSRWKWHALNDPPVLQRVMLDTQLDHKDPNIARLGPPEDPRPQDDAMLSIELDNFVKEKTKRMSQKFKPFQIKMKALKINENFSLRVLDQASVYLLYRDGSTNLKINIGMLLNHEEIVDTDAADIGDVAITMEELPARTASISALQRAANRARAGFAAERVRRARLLGRPEGQLSDIDSADALRAAASRAPRPPLASCSASAALTQCPCDLYCEPLF